MSGPSDPIATLIRDAAWQGPKALRTEEGAAELAAKIREVMGSPSGVEREARDVYDVIRAALGRRWCDTCDSWDHECGCVPDVLDKLANVTANLLAARPAPEREAIYTRKECEALIELALAADRHARELRGESEPVRESEPEVEGWVVICWEIRETEPVEALSRSHICAIYQSTERDEAMRYAAELQRDWGSGRRYLVHSLSYGSSPSPSPEHPERCSSCGYTGIKKGKTWTCASCGVPWSPERPASLDPESELRDHLIGFYAWLSGNDGGAIADAPGIADDYLAEVTSTERSPKEDNDG